MYDFQIPPTIVLTDVSIEEVGSKQNSKSKLDELSVSFGSSQVETNKNVDAQYDIPTSA